MGSAGAAQTAAITPATNEPRSRGTVLLPAGTRGRILPAAHEQPHGTEWQLRAAQLHGSEKGAVVKSLPLSNLNRVPRLLLARRRLAKETLFKLWGHQSFRLEFVSEIAQCSAETFQLD